MSSSVAWFCKLPFLCCNFRNATRCERSSEVIGVLLTVTYDIRNKYVSSNTIGLGYDDSCTSYSLTYEETRTLKTVAGVTSISKPARSIGFFLSFRTLGDFGTKQGTTN